MSAHDDEAKARDEEVGRLHPGKERRHLRATLAGRVVLRDVEKHEHEPQVGLLSPLYVTAVVVDGQIQFYTGADPVVNAGSIATSRVVDIETGHELDYTPPRMNPTSQLKLAEPGTDPLDLELEVFTFDGAELHQTTDIEAELAWWKAAVGG